MNALTTELHILTLPWPFMQWGMDILGPFDLAPGNLGYLIVIVDYFTKWIEVEALTNITVTNVIKFFKRNILAMFTVPQAIVIDNRTYFIDKILKSLLEELKIRQHFASVEHPQTNSQAKDVNQVIFRGLKKSLEEAKGSRAGELFHVLWAYLTTP